MDAKERRHSAYLDLPTLKSNGFSIRYATHIDLEMEPELEEEITRLQTVSPDEKKKLFSKLKRITLPPLIEKMSSLYSEWNLGRRSYFLWQWLHYGTTLTQLPNVASEYRESVLLIKSLINMLNVVLDDIGDEEKNFNLIKKITGMLLDETACAKPRFSDVTEREALQIKFCLKIWKEVNELLDSMPRHQQFHSILIYDLVQMVNGKYFSALVNQFPFMLNSEEHWNYSPHSMHGMIFITIDLMASPAISEEDMGILRNVYWIASTMAHISNCLATWRREVKTKDFSSIIFSIVTERSILSLAHLNQLETDEIIQKVEESKIERLLLKEWLLSKHRILSYQSRLPAVDLQLFCNQNEEFLQMHLACIGVI